MSIESVIQFNHYHIEKIDFNINREFKGNEAQLEFGIDNEVNIDYESSRAIIKLMCKIFPNYIENNYPFHLHLEIVGSFTFERNAEKELLEHLITSNGVTILFPYLRSTISTITSTTGFPTLILPTINVHQYFLNKQMDSTLED